MKRSAILFFGLTLTVQILYAIVLYAEEYSTNELRQGAFTTLSTDAGTWRASDSTAAVLVPPNQNRRSIHYWGAPDRYLVFELAKPLEVDVLILDLERWTSAPPFELSVEARYINEKGASESKDRNGQAEQWRNITKLGSETRVGFGKTYLAQVNGRIDAIRFKLNSKKELGILIHSLDFVRKGPMTLKKVELTEKIGGEPILIAADGKSRPVTLQNILIQTQGLQNPLDVNEVIVEVKNSVALKNMTIDLNGKTVATVKCPVEGANRFSLDASQAARLTLNRITLSVRAEASSKAAVDQSVEVRVASVTIGGKAIRFDEKALTFLFGVLIRDSGWDGVSGYRIPGLVTSNKGTLLAVYDIRYRTHIDLPGDIDIGLSRSFDGGKTWQPMQKAMDRKGADETKEGVGDPTILVDRQTGRIWIAALWAHNGYSTARSEPGLRLETSGQLDLVYSDDDGATWSEPRTITAQAAPGKDWRILFQGPGMGITMRDGTLVFPAQFINKDKIWFSTIVWSKDRGATWTAGTGARPGTCEAQIVELNDGSLMISMRNFKEHARSVAVTKDLAQTWTVHPTSLKALPDPICQASLLRLLSVKDGDKKNLLAFCNPYSASRRDNMSVQFSEDEGQTWKNRILLNKNPGYGYSCMSPIDKTTFGVLYETRGGLIFQRVKFD